jgi:filamentous hemagglutinin
VVAGAQSIMVDPASPPGAGPATLDTTVSGIAQINIAQPNAAGLSHNLFTNYGVAPPGLVLNNATTITAACEGGYRQPQSCRPFGRSNPERGHRHSGEPA